MKNTSIQYKLAASIINILATFLAALPFLYIYGLSTEWKVSWIVIFFFYNVIFEGIYGRCLGMMLCNTHYKSEVPLLRKLVYITLYTASFSTLLFYLWFPFDLLLINLLLLQLPSLLLTKTTLHGFVSGDVMTVRNK